jgi:lipopolysaccharide/colanic/teichoic acid biosynthesis glycosyltransferase
VIYSFAKRLTDVVLSMAAICVSAPAMLVVAVWIKMDSKGPVLYRGARAGRDGNVFHILKFRSMIVDAESKGGFSTAIDDPRLTRVGRFLRRFKLDELPQFFNVLSGDMSLVGPRPQVLFYTDRYTGEERLILSVKPGITDLATLYFADMDAVLGSGDVDARYRNEVEPVKNRLRIRYVRERSYMLDLRILVETSFRLIGIPGATGLSISPGEAGSDG